MTHAEALLGTAIGVWAVFDALFGRGVFHALGPHQRPTAQTKVIPQWLGRLWFFGVGCIFLYWGGPALRGAWHFRDVIGGIWIALFFLAVWLWRKFSSHWFHRTNGS